MSAARKMEDVVGLGSSKTFLRMHQTTPPLPLCKRTETEHWESVASHSVLSRTPRHPRNGRRADSVLTGEVGASSPGVFVIHDRTFFYWVQLPSEPALVVPLIKRYRFSQQWLVTGKGIDEDCLVVAPRLWIIEGT